MDELENLKDGADLSEPARRIPNGRYKALLPTLKHLVVDHGVSVRVAAAVFGLKQSTLTMRLSETDSFVEREERDFQLSQLALAEEIERGTVDIEEYWPRLTDAWREELKSRGISPKSPP